ncbi:MAG: hypothetical protein Q9187_009150 [Circinaria calcarea]
MLPSRSFWKRFDVLLFFCIITVFWLIDSLFLQWNTRFLLSSLIPHYNHRDLSAGNSTLGFQVILTVSSENANDTTAWRQAGLIHAANRTGLQIHVPHQRTPSPEEIKALTDGKAESEERTPTEGQARAWVAHLDILQRIIDTNTTTALILEDDADWDVALRTQLPPIASAVRNLTNATFSHSSPYGANWDLLWLGHCGEIYDNTTHPDILIHDPTIIPSSLLKSVWIPSPYPNFPNHTRAVHYSAGPICTFGYAVTLAGARKVHAYASTTSEAYDVKLNHGCASGALNCIGVMPEVIHHQRMLGRKSLSVEAEADGGAEERRFTFNVRYSARCNWDRWGVEELVGCLPSEEDAKTFRT